MALASAPELGSTRFEMWSSSHSVRGAPIMNLGYFRFGYYALALELAVEGAHGFNVQSRYSALVLWEHFVQIDSD